MPDTRNRTVLPAQAGIGLRHPHWLEFLATRQPVAWLEVHSENYLAPGGPRVAALERLRGDYPLSCHGVGLSLGSAERLDAVHLARLRSLYDRLEPELISEHLAWSTAPDGTFLADLLPMPYTDEVLTIVAANIERAQETLGRRLRVENPSTYPVVRQWVGPECFTATGLTFIAERPPQAPVLYAYGGDFPDFLTGLRPFTELPWLGDVARLEWARNEALFAAESDALTADVLAAVPIDQWPDLQLGLHPATQLVGSSWPIHAIWAAHQPDGEPLENVDLQQPETVMIWQRNEAVRQRLLTLGELALLGALAGQCSLTEAAETATQCDPAFDLSAALARWLNEEVLEAPIMDVSTSRTGE